MTDGSDLIAKMGGVVKAKKILNTWLKDREMLEIGSIQLSQHELRKAIAEYYLNLLRKPTIEHLKDIVTKAESINATYYGLDGDAFYRKGQYKWQRWHNTEWSNLINDSPNDELVYVSNLICALRFLEGRH
ncbi:MAG: hypothetical protein [Bacteriophage sp.]|nr:MAG: hypothetical protein [Bacteriophage sp.]